VRRGLVLLAISATAAAWPGAAPASDRQVKRAAALQLPAVERAAAGGLGSAGSAQLQYNAARTLEGAVPPLAYVSRPCRPLARALLGYAAGVVKAAEGVDRLEPPRTAAGRRRADAALASVDRLGRTCRSGPRPRGVPRQPDVIAVPRAGEAFFGEILEENYGDEARLYANGELVSTVRTAASDVRFHLRRPPGRYRLEIRFLRAGRLAWRSVTPDAFLLPPTARVARPALATNRSLQRRLAGVGPSFGGYAAVYVHDLRTGRAAGWNADARFPAASTVKLAVLVETLRRWEPHRLDLRLDDELRALTGWSSNLAANRLVLLLGDGSEWAGAQRVQSALARLGATRSTYPQAYRVGTSVDAEPPHVSGRVTTARDLGRILRLLAAAASGNRAALRRTGVSVPSARYALGLLLESDREGNNVGLLTGALPHGTPIAQKNGWIEDARHTAAIVYGRGGPTIVVVLTYRPELTLRDAAAFGRRVVRAAL
jgi:beta-lactamase family protein